MGPLRDRIGRTDGGRTETLIRAVRRRIGVDARALAAFRIALAALLLVDLWRRAGDLTAHYADAGAVPRSAVSAAYPGYLQVSLHAISGATWVQAALFLVAGVAAAALLVGYRTRLATLASLVLLVSVQARNPVVLSGADTLLRRLLFWSLFLPLGERWAVDVLGRADARDRIAGPATLGLLGQVVVVYVTNAVLKHRANAWPSGDAVRYVVRLDQFTTPVGDALAGHPGLLAAFAWLWLALLICSPLLVGLTGRRRAALVGAFASAHLGMALVLRLELFPFVSIAALLPFLPAGVWDRIERRASALSRAATRQAPVAFQRVPAALRANGGRRLGPRARSASRTLATVALALMLAINAVGLGAVAAPEGVQEATAGRTWDMFAPSPLQSSSFVVAEGTLPSGQRADALLGTTAARNRTVDDIGDYPNGRWHKLMSRVPERPALREPVARYLCTRWNRAHDQRLREIELVAYSAPVGPNSTAETSREVLGTYRCRPDA